MLSFNNNNNNYTNSCIFIISVCSMIDLLWPDFHNYQHDETSVQVQLYRQHQGCLPSVVAVVYQLLVSSSSSSSSNNNNNDGDECYRKYNPKCNRSDNDPINIVPLSITSSSMGQCILAILIVSFSL